MNSQDQIRAEFEAWARGESPSINLTREGDGYRYSLAEMLYGAWQAARAAAPALPPILNDAMRAVLINEHDVFQTPEALYEALLASAPAQAGWMPIESAPKDGTPLLAFWATAEIEPNKRNWGLTAFVDFEWRNLYDYEMCFNPPTHWMPLPQPPKEQT